MSLDNKQMTEASVDDKGSGINHWLRLSDEMALYILRHLPQTSLKTVSLVNKKLRDLSQQGRQSLDRANFRLSRHKAQRRELFKSCPEM